MRIWLVGLIMLLCTPAFSQQQPLVVAFDSVPDLGLTLDDLHHARTKSSDVHC